MPKKQIIGAVAGVLAVVLASAIIYQQFAGTNAPTRTTQSGAPAAKPSAKTAERTLPKETAVPSSIDGISQSIADETSADESALNDEEKGEAAQIEADSQSVTNLSASYDENSF